MRPILTPRRLDAALTAAGLLFDLAPTTITRRSRNTTVAQARHATIAALYEACQTSYSELARYFDRDHTTVMYAVSRAREIAAGNTNYADAVALIAREVRSA